MKIIRQQDFLDFEHGGQKQRLKYTPEDVEENYRKDEYTTYHYYTFYNLQPSTGLFSSKSVPKEVVFRKKSINELHTQELLGWEDGLIILLKEGQLPLVRPNKTYEIDIEENQLTEYAQIMIDLYALNVQPHKTASAFGFAPRDKAYAWLDGDIAKLSETKKRLETELTEEEADLDTLTTTNGLQILNANTPNEKLMAQYP